MLLVLPAQYYAESGRRYPDQFADEGYEVTVAFNAPDVVEVCADSLGSNQVSKNIPVDLPLADVSVANYDAVVFIGGLGCRDSGTTERRIASRRKPSRRARS